MMELIKYLYLFFSFFKMSILNSRIPDFSLMKYDDLLKYIDKKYFDGNVFLSIKFFLKFEKYFNCDYEYFAEYIDEYNLFSPSEIIEFFYYL